MTRVLAVALERYGRLHYFSPGELEVKVGDKVLVVVGEASEVAEVVWPVQELPGDMPGLQAIQALATEADVARASRVRRRRGEAAAVARAAIRARELPMKLCGAEFLEDRGRFLFYFTAENRVDFRDLLRDLSSELGARVEFRQIGARDEAKLQGGLGPCGRDLCCANFLKDFEPVSIRMAKDQGLPLNPLKISGACGRLMCCLKYEHSLYQDFKAVAPDMGTQVSTAEGPGVVVDYQVPAERVVVQLAESGRQCTCPLRDVARSREAYEQRYGC